jgi:putative holliday junction resolvase
VSTAPGQLPVPIVADRGTVLAFDFGTRRIGVAVGELDIQSAHPLGVIENRSKEQCFGEIAKLVSEWRPALLVVGQPVHEGGRAHELTALVQRFADRLKRRFKLPTVLSNEQFTSVAAASDFREAGIAVGNRKHIDAAAARLILTGYFNELAQARRV